MNHIEKQLELALRIARNLPRYRRRHGFIAVIAGHEIKVRPSMRPQDLERLAAHLQREEN